MLDQFQLIGRKLFEEGLISSHGGNMSIREGGRVFITRTGVMLSELKEEDIIEVSLEAGDQNDSKASVELPVHRAIYKETNVGAIVHAHPSYAIALSLNEEKIYPQDTEGRHYMRAVPVVRAKEAIAAEEAIKQFPAIFSGGYHITMLKGHGSFAAGETLEEAYKYTSVLELSSRILAIQKSISRPQVLQGGGQGRQGGQQRHRNEPHNRFGEKRKSVIPQGIGIMGRRVNYRKR